MGKLSFFEIIMKYNPYHDERGRFATANASVSFSIPKDPKLRAKLIERERQRTEALYGPYKETKPKKPKTAPVATRGHVAPGEFFYGAYSLDEKVNVLRADLEKSSGKKVSEKAAREMYITINNYTGTSYSTIRRAFVDKKPPESYQQAMALEKYIRLSPKWGGGELYRGIKLDYEQMSQFKVGQTLTMKGPSSWSSRRSLAEDFTGGLNVLGVVFVLPKTTRGASVKHLSEFPSEDEVLVSGKAKFKIKKITETVITPYKKQGWQIELEEINK